MSKSSRTWFIGGMIFVVLVAISIPTYKAAILRSRESVLRLNLSAVREVIKSYTHDKQRAPQSLNDLVAAGYFRELPIDPTTNSNSTWKPVMGPDGIADLRSGSESISSNGRPYQAW